MTLAELSLAIEALIVERNVRRMAELRAALDAGYCLRAARILSSAKRVVIGTGFPVDATFETDGPPGATALYRALEQLGADCVIACAAPLADVLSSRYEVLELRAFNTSDGKREADAALAQLHPDAVVSIERPGLASDGRYYNMRGQDISHSAAVFDYYLERAQCPTIAMGDGGNEIGMGKVATAVSQLAVRGASTTCDELIVADVSNWAAYAVIAVMQALHDVPLLEQIDHEASLRYLSSHGSVDGVTRANTCTEDGMPDNAGRAVLNKLQELAKSYTRTLE